MARSFVLQSCRLSQDHGTQQDRGNNFHERTVFLLGPIKEKEKPFEVLQDGSIMIAPMIDETQRHLSLPEEQGEQKNM